MSNPTLNNKNKIVKTILSILLGLIGLGFIAFFLLTNGLAEKSLLSSSDPLTYSSATSSVSSDASSSGASSQGDTLYPTDKLFVTTDRESYTDGDMILRVPKFDLVTKVLDGTDPEILDRGVGLYEYAQLPGKSNRNTSITAHRNTQFEPIETIGKGDMIYLEYDGYEYTYEYEGSVVVKDDDWSILHCKDYPVVTLVSCHPVNSSKNRIVVTGRLVDQKPLSEVSSVATASSKATDTSSAPTSSEAPSSKATVDIEENLVPQSAAPPSGEPVKAVVLTPSAGGTVEASGGGAVIDASNTSQGYIMAKYDGSATKVKLQIKGPNGVTYSYNLHPGVGFETFPLTAGNGSYKVSANENISGTTYAVLLGETYDVSITNSLSPYLYPNQYVNFSTGSATVAKGETVASGSKSQLDTVSKVYNYVIGNIKYDDAKANQIIAGTLTGYLPVVDDVLKAGKGICFDYAAVMATMLRSQQIPTRLEVGYVTGGIYHAWLSIYTPETGWINGIIQFDGKSWKLMDPTFASSSNSSKSIMQFIGNGSNYQTKYVY